MTHTVSLGDVVDIFDGPHATPKKTGSGPVFLGISNLKNGRLNLSNVEHLSEADFPRWTRRVTPRFGDIVFSYETRLGEAAIIPSGFYGCLGRRMGLLRPRQGVVDSDFLLYYWLSPTFQSQIQAKKIHGSTVERIALTELPKFEITLPPINEQKSIAKTLKTIDEKIELNRKMNETLDQMGQALFRHYFIDNPEAEKWKDGVITDLVHIYSGHAFKRTDFDSDGMYGLVTIKNVQDGSFISECSDRLSELPHKIPEYIHLKTGDVLLSLTGNVGRVCIVTGEDLLLNQRVAKLVGVDGWHSFAYFLFRQSDFKERLILMSRGTAQLNLSPVETKQIKTKLPPQDMLERFYDQAEPIFDTLTENYRQIQTLTILRDTLLPRLINGKVRV